MNVRGAESTAFRPVFYHLPEEGIAGPAPESVGGERRESHETAGIERKFLVKSDGWRGKGSTELFRQGYIARTQDRTVRVARGGRAGHIDHQVPRQGYCAGTSSSTTSRSTRLRRCWMVWIPAKSLKSCVIPSPAKTACGRWTNFWEPMRGSWWRKSSWSRKISPLSDREWLGEEVSKVPAISMWSFRDCRTRPGRGKKRPDGKIAEPDGKT